MPNFRFSFRSALLALALTTVVAPAAYAAFSDGYTFLKAVTERDGAKAEKFINEPGSVIINTRADDTGKTALHIVIAGRDLTWTSYLLSNKANPNIADKKGVTPLMLATQYNFADGAAALLQYKASVDATNRSGETALIRAVQLRFPEMVRLLLKNGANPDKRDAVAGRSAREYAALDGRSSAILAIIENRTEPTAPAQKQGDLDFSGVK